jgi:protein involved in sex pheromone biosynthesis
MKKAITILNISLLIIIISSCSSFVSQREIHDSWMGSHKSELIRSWGPPTRIQSDGEGGEILIYESAQTSGYIIGDMGLGK